MAKYKNIGSAIHNWAHSFLSIENYDEEGYFIKELYEAALASNANEISIDVLSQSITPSSTHTDRVNDFMQHSRESFTNQLLGQNVEPSMISLAILKLRYNFSAPMGKIVGFSFGDPWKTPQAAVYTTEITAVDDRGIKHRAELPEWWR